MNCGEEAAVNELNYAVGSEKDDEGAAEQMWAPPASRSHTEGRGWRERGGVETSSLTAGLPTGDDSLRIRCAPAHVWS